jgi:energy-converting hydrogenase A subunit M
MGLLYDHCLKNISMVQRTVSKDLPISEITLRKYEKPFDLKGRDLVKKFCLSMGLLNPGDSRDVIVDVFSVIFNSEEPLSSKNVEEKVIFARKTHGRPMIGITPPNIRRQIKRLRDIFLVQRTGNLYKITEDQELIDIFVEKIEHYHLHSIIERVKEYFRALGRSV